MKVNGKDYSIYEMENKNCLKPPSSVRFNRVPFVSSTKMSPLTWGSPLFSQERPPEISRNHWGTAPTGLCIWPRQATPSAQSHASMFSKESMSRAPKAFLGFPWQNPYLTIYIIFCCTIFSMFLGTNIMRSSGVGRWPVLLHHAGRFLGILEASHLR